MSGQLRAIHDICVLHQDLTEPHQVQTSRGGPRGGAGAYSGFRTKIQVYTFIVASEKKNTRGGVQFEILRNPGIDFYSGFRKKIQVYTFIVASEKKTQGWGCNSKS